jgi:hypothetical protein
MKKYPERYNYLLINAANQVDLNIQTLQEIIKQLEELNK